jgi:hypothetical protein
VIHHLTHDIGWPVLALGALIVLGAGRPLAARARFELELSRRARRIRAREGMVDLTPTSRARW